MNIDIQTLAARVDEAARTASPIEQLSHTQEFGLEEAYAIQKASLERRYQRGEKLIGVKLGFTSQAKMEQMGVHDMIWGRLTDAMLIEANEVFNLSGFIHPRAEPEICFRVKKKIDRLIDQSELLEYIDGVAPAIEIIDSRFRDFKFSLADVIADNCSSAGLVIGEWLPAEVPLAEVDISIEVNGEVKATGFSSAILGDPWQSVIAASRLATKYGQTIPAGSFIMAGAATQAVFLEEDQFIKVKAGELGSVGFKTSGQEVCIIIGASHAAAQLAPDLRHHGWAGKILVIGEELNLPYHRPPLSKAYLLGKKEEHQILIRGEGAYEKLGVEFLLGKRVIGINRERRTVSLNDNRELHYDKLAITTGGRVKKLNIPGVKLKHVFYLRDKKDSDALKAAISPGKKAVVIGGGYIGLETAAALKTLGMEVTVLEAMDRGLPRVTAPEVSQFFHRVHQEEGVTIHTGKVVTRLTGEDTVRKVVCLDESEYEADIVIIGIGIIPNVELAEDAGLAVQDGIMVDEFGQTEDPDIVAAGDCTNHPSHRYQLRIRLESVPNATDQAKSAAAAICGKKIPYTALPWFWSEQYDIMLQIAGVNTDYDQIVIRGDIENSRSFVVWYLKNGHLIAADCVNRPKEFIAARMLIEKGIDLAPDLLKDEDYDPKEMLILARQSSE